MTKDNTELAKSWFQLSQVLAVLAGLFLVVGSLHASSYSSLRYNFDIPLGLCEKMTEENFSLNTLNVTYPQCVSLLEASIEDEVALKEGFTNFLIGLGFLMALDSIIVWFIGRRKLVNPQCTDMLLFVLLIIINIGIILFLWFYIMDPLTGVVSKTMTIGNRTFTWTKKTGWWNG